jgi:uncharacterized protein
MRIVITGATGFVGRALVQRLLKDGHEVRVLTRDAARAAGELPVRCRLHAWDPASGTIDAGALRHADAVVHLAGAGVADGRWTPARKRAIVDSRVAGSRLLVSSLTALDPSARPRVLVSASAIGFYGDRGDEPLDEQSASGQGFLPGVCDAWEREVRAAADAGLRVATIRIGIVLGRGGGALERMLPPFRLGCGGRLGSGRQWMSWIHLADLVEAFVFALERDDVRGVVNGVAPTPVTNRVFTRTLAAALRRPALFPVPALALHLLLGEMSVILLASQRVEPRALAALGFAFAHRELDGALADLCADHARVLESEQWVARPPAEVFAFFANAYNLETLTPDFLRFRVLSVTTPTLREGTRIDYRLRIRGVPVRWQSVIESWEPERRFVDVQSRGPYKHWQHTHEFEALAGGTVVRDRVRYELPLGPLGGLLAGGMVARDLASIFAFRHAKVAALFPAAAAGAACDEG